MPPPGYEPFLHEILARPLDDAPRLVYADWLEEQGDARGEFIRIQCQLAGFPDDDPRNDRFADRESQLLSQYGDQWREELPYWARAGCDFRRGFVERVPLWHREYFNELETLRLQTPVQTLALHDAAGAMPLLLQSGALHWLDGLEILDSRAAFQELRDLVHPPQPDEIEEVKLLGLRRFAVMGVPLRDAGALLLALTYDLPVLESLELVRCFITDRGISEFARTTRLTHLKKLDLSENHIDDVGAWHLANAEQRAGLTHLSLRDAGLTDAGARYLAESPHLQNLVFLDLSTNRLTDASAMALAAAFPSLRRIALRGCYLTQRGLYALHQRFGRGAKL